MSSRTTAQPEPEDAANQEFQVVSRHEITAILREVIERRLLVTLYFGPADGFIVTSLLRLNPDFEELVFDPAQDASINHAIEAAGRLTFVTFVDQIKTQFSTPRAEATRLENHPALRTRLPQSVLRLQRRNFFRVAAPQGTPLACQVPMPDGELARFVIDDLSVGGVAMLAGPGFEIFAAGTVLENCRIELPEHGVITTTIELRNQGPAGDRVRYGCRFLYLAGTVASLLQRYISQLERTRRALG